MRSGGGIVVTGMGSLGAGGCGMGALWENTAAGRINSTRRHLASIGRDISVYAADGEPALSAAERRLTRHADRSVLLALAAAKEAWHAAGLHEGSTGGLNAALVVGSSRGPAGLNCATARPKSKHATDSAYTTFSSICGVISAALEIHGCSMMTSATCISGAAALKTAVHMMCSGEYDAILVGGVDAPLVDSILEQFAATKVLAAEVGPAALRPFGRERHGTVMGEGAAFLVLETEASAMRRGAPIRGFVHHVAISRDASFRTGGNENGEALRRVTEQTLRMSGWSPAQVDFLHLHGTGTMLNDAMESHCVQSVFGPPGGQPYSWATKGITGHTLGASPLFQVVLTLEAFLHSVIPATANGADLDPACQIRLTGGSGVSMPLRTALCLTSGFWGNTSCIALGSHGGTGAPA